MVVRRRFMLSLALSDLAALAVASVVGTLVVFDTPLPWDARPVGGGRLMPTVLLMGLGAILASYVSARMWAMGVLSHQILTLKMLHSSIMVVMKMNGRTHGTMKILCLYLSVLSSLISSHSGSI